MRVPVDPHQNAGYRSETVPETHLDRSRADLRARDLAEVAGSEAGAARRIEYRMVAEVLRFSAELEAALKAAPAGWRDKNLQIVFRIEVVRDNVGPPKVLSSYVW